MEKQSREQRKEAAMVRLRHGHYIISLWLFLHQSATHYNSQRGKKDDLNQSKLQYFELLFTKNGSCNSNLELVDVFGDD